METDKFRDWMYVSYEKMPESFSKWNLSESDYRAFKKTDWVVTEKIHGANFCIISDREEVRFAKRQELLNLNEDFFGVKTIAPQLAERVKEIFKIINSEDPNILRISVYGELFGGEYPHPDVIVNANVQAVQTGIYYSPNIEYCAFDVAIEYRENVGGQGSDRTQRTYLDYDKAVQIFQQVGLLYSQPLFMGKYEKALAYNIGFESTIPTLLGLPKLPFSNKAEGIVIKPVKSIYVETAKGKFRPILKIKIPEFAEDSRFHQAKKWNYQTYSKTDQSLSTESSIIEAILPLVTETRLDNVISKIGRVSRKDKKAKERLKELFVTDVLETFNENYAESFSTLSSQSQQNILFQLDHEAQQLIDNYLQR